MENSITNEKYWYWLCNIEGIYGKKRSGLIKYFHKPVNIYNASEKELSSIKALSDTDIINILNSKDIEKINEKYNELSKQGIRFYSIENNKYPNRLRNISNPPFGIYVKGELLLDIPTVAIVGARDCSNYGRSKALEYAGELSSNNIQIISGMARGIDSYAHKGALEFKGRTFAVFGSGVNVCYPKENYMLYEEILKSGGIISEYQINQSPRALFFPERNRIISALSDIVLVIEARERSGSLITADFALEQGKDIYALPGRVTDPLSYGCNMLINQGAFVAISPQEIINALGIKCEQSKKLFKNNTISLERNENMVYSCLDLQPKSLNNILGSIDLKYNEIISILIELEMQGLIKEISKNYYVKL